jgi:hypothetical protein
LTTPAIELWANEIAGKRARSETAAATLVTAFRIERMMRTSKRSLTTANRDT